MRVVSIMIGRYTVSYDFTDQEAAEKLYEEAKYAVVTGQGMEVDTPGGRICAAAGQVLGADIEDPEANIEPRKAVAVARKQAERAIDKAVDESGAAIGIGRD